MNNYPPGMTKEDWKHIDGETHSPLCPQHEDFEHKCNAKMPNRIYPDLSNHAGRFGWNLVVKRLHTTELSIDFCPYCGEELGPTDCICKELKEGGR